MFLPVPIDFFCENVLRLEFSKGVREELCRVTGRSERRVRIYLKSKTFPPGISNKLKIWLLDQGFQLPEMSFAGGISIPLGWKGFCEGIQREGTEFLPKTFQFIHRLALRDMGFVQSLQVVPVQQRLAAYRRYLSEEVAPTFCLDTSKLAVAIGGAKKYEDLQATLARVYLEGILHLVSLAEGEYLLANCNDSRSGLAKCLVGRDDGKLLTPSQKFFRSWFKSLSLSIDEFVQELLDHYGESECADPSVETDSEGINRESVKRRIERCFAGELPLPSYEVMGKWALGIYARAAEIQKRKEGHEAYRRLLVDVYGGVQILDRTFREWSRILPETELVQTFSTYELRFKRHLTALEKEAG